MKVYGKVPNGNMVLFYAGEFGYFMSNFSAFMVEYNGLLWPTSEHAYQAAKFDVGSKIYTEIYTARSAHIALKLAIKNSDHVRTDWDSCVKVKAMEAIVTAKHDQHEYIQRKLQETGDAWLIENSQTDSFWGRGPDWKGRNELGKIWMKIRKEHYGT